MSMSKIAMEILSIKNPTVAELRSKIAETENSLWCGSNRSLNMGKFAGGAPGFELGEQVEQGEQLDNLLEEDFASPATALATGRANVLEYVPNATREDINQNGVEAEFRHHPLL